MDNASLILQTLDGHLDHSVRLVLYGRAALQLGFADPPQGVAQSKDVDCIIPVTDLDTLTADDGFWNAQESTNLKLRPLGLYITHLFGEDQVFLRQKWEQFIEPVAKPTLRNLRLFRPATIDLVLSKMMRGNDPQDTADAEFMIRRDHITEPQLREAFTQMKPIELAELRDAFAKAEPIVLQFAREAGSH